MSDVRRAVAGLTALEAAEEPETLSKISALMGAGRDAQPIDVSWAGLAAAEPEQRSTQKLFEDPAQSLDNLRRGHAMACATQFDLEAKLAEWSLSRSRGPLDERVWLRFGKELASSSPAEWTCFASVGPNSALQALFVRRGAGPWWSFDSVVDRPSGAAVAKRQRAPKSSPQRLVPSSFEALIGHACRADRRALRRATQAISARIGAHRE